MPARLPIEVVQARGKKHLTKEEIRARSEQEIKPLDGEIIAPSFLTAKQKKEFYKIADQLQRLKILGETDTGALARYITANDFYINAVKKLRSKDVQDDPTAVMAWSKVQDQYFKQCRSAANDLGLSISARCKLVVPSADTSETPVTNKFASFEKGGASE